LGQGQRQADTELHGPCRVDAAGFAERSNFPQEYRGDAFATMHGSWNRKPPSGYEVVRIRFKDGKPESIEPFATGFLIEQPDGTWGRFARPFGLAIAKNGSMLMGDEQNGIIFASAPSSDIASN
jgi:glucose/arabinose dehydrogenase